jgi:hypothetical protein
LTCQTKADRQKAIRQSPVRFYIEQGFCNLKDTPRIAGGALQKSALFLFIIP